MASSALQKRPAVASQSKAPRGRLPAATKMEVLRRPASTSERSRSPQPPTRRTGRNDPLSGLKALLLGLERRPDRRERCDKMLKKEAAWLQVDFFRATDGKVDKIPPRQVAKTWNTKNNSHYGSYEDVMDKGGKVIYTAAQFADPGVVYEFSPGERGCAHSHYRMWKLAAAAEGPTLILEDDVQLVFERTNGSKMTGAAFEARLRLGMQEAINKDADVLYLSWSGFRDGNYKHLQGQRGRKNAVIRKVEYVWTTAAYVIWPAGAAKLLERAAPMDQPVDNFMAWESREGRLASYVLLDEGDDDETWAGGVATQLDFTGDSDITKSDGGDQGDDPAAFLVKKSKA